MKHFTFDAALFKDFYWFNEPGQHWFDTGLKLVTEADTDFWQNTHYGFKRDNGHCLFTTLKGDFSFTAEFEYEAKALYDQCGIIARVNEENWIKASTEYENETISRLGSVVTNLGYSDWATTDISTAVTKMWYRISKNGSDFLIENSVDGHNWKQMRITHLHTGIKELEVGIYACSPQQSSFECTVKTMILDDNKWGI